MPSARTIKVRNGVGGPAVPPGQLSPQTCGPRTSCPPGLVVLGPAVPRTRSPRTGCPPSGQRVPHSIQRAILFKSF